MHLLTCNWKALLPFILFAFFVLYEDWVSIPSCTLSPRNATADGVFESKPPQHNLKVMMVANLLLLGSEANAFDQYFRDYYLSKFFKKSFYSLRPDLLLVMGDVSAKGYELAKTKWASVVHQFHGVLGPFLELPFHVVLGDRDIGECNNLDSRFVHWVSRSFPGLDSAGCGGFAISNMSFFSLNAVALVCGNNKLRFGVERAIEMESIDLRMETKETSNFMDDDENFLELHDRFRWGENELSPGSGPVLLLHFPLHRTTNDNCKEGNNSEKASNSVLRALHAVGRRRFIGNGPYDSLHTVPENATDYIFQALRPRIVFSAHSHDFCDRIHSDGTREVTVPAMTWKAKDDPGFVIATFHGEKGAISISYCLLARESHVIVAYTCFLILLLTTWFTADRLQLRCLRL